MKHNGNDQVKGTYYLGLDVGTNSVGWAVTDYDYHLLKHRGNAMWGVRLFDEAQPAADRRANRTNRRRLARRNQRLLLLESLFAEEVQKTDPGFFLRMEESTYWIDDKTDKTCRFALFHDKAFTDKDYHRRYPTIYHLRTELMQSKKPHDVRLVYLALHHIMKHRGHFLYDDVGQDEQLYSIEDAFAELAAYVQNEYGLDFELKNQRDFFAALLRDDIGVKAKQKLLNTLWEDESGEEDQINLSISVNALAGASVKLSALFRDKSLDEGEVKSVALATDLDEQYDVLSDMLGDRADLLLLLKNVFDAARLSRMLEGFQTISEAKIALYEKNRRDLRELKKFVRKYAPEKYKEIFSAKRDKLNNYAAYSGYRNRSGAHSCKQEEFCKYLLSVLPEPETESETTRRIFYELREGVFLTKLKGTDNGVIPFQLHRAELKAILANASGYLPFLNEPDETGITVREKIEKTFEFRIPYYVGPLNKNAGSYWAVRFEGKEQKKIYPWNFNQVIDTESSARAYIEKLIGRCTYTGERVLPKDSLLYSEYMLLNELNPISVNGKPLAPSVKQNIVRDLFQTSRKRVTKKQIKNYLVSKGLITQSDEIAGIDESVKTVLKSYYDFRLILDKTGDSEMVEDIIRHVLIFGEDRVMLKKWLRNNTHGLDEADYSYICRLHYAEWGSLSKTFLTEIMSEDPDEGTGEAHSIMDLLRSGNRNLMQLLSDRYAFAKHAEEHRNAVFGISQSLTERMDEMYISPAVRRSIRQTLRIVDEIVDIRKSVPEKIFIEMARDSSKTMKGKRTESRKAKLLALYGKCREEGAALLPQLEKEDDNSLRSDRRYLYYLQFGKCMYSGESIDLDALMDGRLFDIDHVFPRSRIKDNSLDNRVVVRNTLNREKTNDYPIRAEIRAKMHTYWRMLKDHGMISTEKFDRLVRGTPLTEAELSSFVARQLVETRQSTKALTVLLKERYGEKTRIVFSKAGNVSDFRQQFDLIKCREVNDLHHAKDAYLNVVVGNVYCTRFTDRFFANIRNENYSLNKLFDFDVPGAWDAAATILTVRDVMRKNNPLVTRMSREVKGQLFDLQLMPAGKGQLRRKQSLDIARYGGYNKLTGAYYLVAEHTVKGKRVRSIEPVYLYQQTKYESEPVRYCTDVLGLVEPKIICPELRADALLEIDGSRLYISGRTGDRCICEHAYQLAIDSEKEKQIKAIGKYLERCAAQRKELPITERDGITAEGNLVLYRFFCEKLKTNVYHKLLANMEKDLTECAYEFAKKSISEQAALLLEILKAFRCNAQKPNLSRLNGKGEVGAILLSKKLNNFSSAYLLHQSVTGLYEIREDLMT